MHTFATHLRHLWQQYPNQPIIHVLSNNKPEVSLTYSELFTGAVGYAQKLQLSNIQPGEVVVIILKHGIDLILAYWGAILHGAIPTILPFLTEKLAPEQYRHSLAALFTITHPTAVITYTEFVPEVRLAIQEAPDSQANCTILDSNFIQPTLEDINDDFAGYQREPEDIVLLQHSSGTTGLQKGIALSHQAVFNQLLHYSKAIQLSESDTIISWLPLYHDMGLIAGFILPILNRVPLVLLSPFDWVRAPYRLFHAVSDFRGTLVWLPNFAFNFCAQKIRDRHMENVKLNTLRAVINCSEPMYVNSHKLFLERFKPYGLKPDSLATCYAMAENVFAVTQGGITTSVVIDKIDAKIFTENKLAVPVNDHRSSIELLSAGKPLENARIKILSEDRQRLNDRQIGEIAINSDCMLSEYYHRLDLTDKAFHNGWYLTGDMGYQADGELFITGRKKDLIIVGGKNIYPQDLEYLANSIEGIHPGRVVAFGIANTEIGTEDVVIIAEVEDKYYQDNDLRLILADKIRSIVTQGSDISLRNVEIVQRGWLIKTSSGKISRSANKEKFLINFQGFAAGRQAGSNS